MPSSDLVQTAVRWVVFSFQDSLGDYLNCRSVHLDLRIRLEFGKRKPGLTVILP